MPTSIDPQPAHDEVECANCGAYFYIELTRCPNCGVDVYASEADEEDEGWSPPHSGEGIDISRLGDFLRRVFLGEREPHKRPSSRQRNALYESLLTKVRGDHATAQRLIAAERRRSPHANLDELLEDAIRRWERDNA